MRTTDPKFWEELTGNKQQDLPPQDVVLPEDVIPQDDVLDVESVHASEVQLQTVVSSMVTGTRPEGVSSREDGGLSLTGEAESMDADVDVAVEPAGSTEESTGRGKRRKIANRLYSSGTFWRHDGDESDAS